MKTSFGKNCDVSQEKWTEEMEVELKEKEAEVRKFTLLFLPVGLLWILFAVLGCIVIISNPSNVFDYFFELSRLKGWGDTGVPFVYVSFLTLIMVSVFLWAVFKASSVEEQVNKLRNTKFRKT